MYINVSVPVRSPGIRFTALAHASSFLHIRIYKRALYSVERTLLFDVATQTEGKISVL